MPNKKFSCVVGLCLMLMLTATNLHGQETDINVPLYTGLAVPGLDRGSGIYIGTNPSLGITNRLRLEMQASFARIDIGSSFLSGRTGFETHLNILAGARFYLIRNEDGSNIFVNGLTGFNRNNRDLSGLTATTSNQLGLSGGAYYERKRFIAGIAAETNAYLVLKVGISLYDTSR